MNIQKPRLQFYYSRVYFALKGYIDNQYSICLLSLRIRSFVVLSAFGEVIRALYEKFGNKEPLKVSNYSLFPNVDVDRVINNLNVHGYSLGINLCEQSLTRILEFCGNKEIRDYENPHEECETIYKIAHDKKNIDVAKRYLSSEPKLWFTTIYWSLPGARREGNILYRTYPSFFHYDTLDFKALTLFIYLTDVDEYCAPHLVIANTHSDKSLSKILSPLISTDTARHKYGDKLKVILGQKGTGFFEDVMAYHKQSEVCKKPRLMLRICYTLLRGSRPRTIKQGRERSRRFR